MGHENLHQALDPQGCQVADLKQLCEHQHSLRLFMEQWLTQQDQILQAITVCVQNRQKNTSQTLQLEACLALGSQVLDQAGSCQSEPYARMQINDQPSQVTRERSLARDISDGSKNTDILHPVRGNVTSYVRQASDSCRSSMSSVLNQQWKSAPPSLRQLVSERLTNKRMVKLVSSQWFEGICSLCIIANAVVIACAADYAARNLGCPRHPTLEGLEMGFAAFYVIELTLRLVAYRMYFFFAPDSLWNIFDSMLVVSAAYDLVISFKRPGKSQKAKVVFLRIVRVMKMLKLLRMIRIMRLFRELRLIASLIRASLKPMVWAVVLICIISYMVGICFLQAGTNYLQDGGASQGEAAAIQIYWGNLWRAMLSLYMASTNGDSWKTMASALIPMGYHYYLLFLLYVAFFVFVVMNTLTSLFLEVVIQNADKDTNTLIREELQRKGDYVTKAAELFRKIDKDGSGDVTEEEFRRYLKDADLAALASSLDLDVADMAQFHKMLSGRGKYSVDIDTFAVGCMKLKGPAKSIDLQALIASQRRAARTLEHLVEASEGTAALVQQLLSINHSTSRSPSQGAIPIETAVPAPAPTPGDDERCYL